eukprot:9778498-Ditylum_brightwellii.AAC.1
MAKTNLKKLQQIQNNALWVALGTPRCTRVFDLHLEANLLPLVEQYKIAMTFQAEKYRRHP